MGPKPNRADEMSKPNARLKLSFTLDLQVPEEMSRADSVALSVGLCEALGATVMQGLPAISAKQFGKAGVKLLSHHHHAEAENLLAPRIAADLVAKVTAHLTDEEIETVCVKAAAKAPTKDADLLRYLRRQVLALVGEYRLVPCRLAALDSAGAMIELDGRLNLTNGSVMLSEQFRKARLKSDQGPIPVRVEGVEPQFSATLSGHTLSGPVLAVEVMHLVAHRPQLIGLWRQP